MRRTIQLSRYDAELDTDVCDANTNMNLTLTLRLGFTQVNPAGGAAEGTYHDYNDPDEPTRRIVRWTDGTWSHWKSVFANSAQRFWNGKFWLINPGNLFAFEDGGQTYIPNAYCRMRIVAQEGTATNNHHTISVVRLHSSERWFGSHSRLYDSLDMRPREAGENDDGTPIMQRAHVHEVGHLLGLGHVDEGEAHCPNGPSDDTNITACYGLTDFDQNSVMGQGMQLRAEHAAPWQSAMRRFAFDEATQRSNTQTTMAGAMAAAVVGLGSAVGLSTWDARMQRHYPRTPAEVAARTMVTRPRAAAAAQ